jgi:hypothetical protein
VPGGGGEEEFADGKEISAGELCSWFTLAGSSALSSSPGIRRPLTSGSPTKGLRVSTTTSSAAVEPKPCDDEYRTEKTKTVESSRSSSSEDLTFLRTTALHSLLLLLCSSLGLAVVLGEEGEVGSGAMLAGSVLFEGCEGGSASAILVVSVQLLQEHLVTSGKPNSQEFGVAVVPVAHQTAHLASFTNHYYLLLCTQLTFLDALDLLEFWYMKLVTI